MLGPILHFRQRIAAPAVLPLLLLALAIPGCDDDPTETGLTATVSGVVTDHPGDLGIPDATVTGSALGTQLFSVTTDSAGMYEATFDVDDEPTEIAITADGDRFSPADTTVAFSETVNLDLALAWDAPFTQDCIAVNPDNISIQQSGSDFLVVDGSVSLMVFPELSEAQDAQDLIEHYGFNEMCFVGRPDPGMTYWLTDGGPMPAGSGSPVDEDCIAVDPYNVSIDQSGSDFLVVDGAVSLMVFPELAEAQDAVERIEFFQLTDMCFVGRPDPGMTYWLR